VLPRPRHHAAELAASVPAAACFEAPFFKEFAPGPGGAADVVPGWLTGLPAGPALGGVSPELADCLLIAVTERRSPKRSRPVQGAPPRWWQ